MTMAEERAERSTETHDEIEEIMSEIEQLQEQMGEVSATALKSYSNPPAHPSSPASAPVVATPAPQSVLPIPPQVQISEEASETLSMEKETSQVLEESAPIAAQLDVEEILREFAPTDGSEPWLEETLSQLSPETTSGAGLLDSPSEEEMIREPAPEKVESPKRTLQTESPRKEALSSVLSSVLSMSVQGDMAIQLNYGQEGEWISIEFSGDFLNIRLSNGTELKAPTNRSQSS